MFYKHLRSKLSRLIYFWVCLTMIVSCSLVSLGFVYASDGSGTAIVSKSPSTTLVNSTGNTLTFTFSASESMNSGGISLSVPSGWSAPQGTVGTPGYTTVSTTGVVGSVFNEADSVTNWVRNSSNPTACSGGLTIDTVTKHSGTGSLKCVNSSDSNNGLWYYSTSTAMDWSSYQTIGFWINSSASIDNGDLKFDYSVNTNLSTPAESLSLGTAIPANTWTYVSFNFGATTRSAIKSYGLHIANLSSMRNATVYIDSFAIGASASIVPTFSGRDIVVSAISLADGQTITVTYGAGGGASGATAPSAPETSTFTLKSKTVDSGTLTSIGTSPTVSVVDTTAPTVSLTAPTTGSTLHGNSVSLAASASDNVAIAGIKYYLDGVSLGAEVTSGVSYASTFDSTAKSDGSHTITAVARDTSSNFTTSTAAIVTIDNTAPVLSPITLVSNNASTTLAKTGDRVTLTFTANEAISTPTVSFTSGGVSASSSPTITNTSGNTWTASYLTTSSHTNGAVGFSITATDSSSNSRTVTTLSSGSGVTFDRTAPTLSSVSLASNNASTTQAKTGDTITLSFTASESISTPTIAFRSGGDTITGSVTVTNVSGNDWTATYTVDTSDTEGNITFSVSSFHDAVGNSGSTVTSGSGVVNVDQIAPSIQSLTSTAAATTGDSPIPITLVFSEAIAEFDSDQISVTGGTASNFSGSGTTYTFDITPTANGLVTVEVEAGAGIDGAGHANTDSEGLSRTFSSARPTVALSVALSSPTNHSPVSVTATFSAAVTGFTLDDLSGRVTRGSASNFSGSGTTYTFDITPTSDGVVSLSLAASAAVDAATGVNQSFASSPLSFTYDSVSPTVSQVTPVSTPTTDTTPSYTFTTSEGGTITYGGGCSSATSVAVSGSNTIIFSTLADGTYNCTITIIDDAGNASETLALSAFTVDNTAPTISNISVTPSATSVTVRWDTNENASSKVNYGLVNSYGTSTTEQDTSPRVTSHSMSLSGLVKCSTYHYQVVSRDATANSRSSVDGAFTTRGCAGNANVLTQSATAISKDSGGSAALAAVDRDVSLVVPTSYGGADAQFQIKQLVKDTALEALGTPTSEVSAAGAIYDLRALLAVDTIQNVFDGILHISLTYTASDIVGLDESTLKIYRNDDDVWTELTNCVVDTGAKSVTCETEHFSTFAIFGQPSTTHTSPSIFSPSRDHSARTGSSVQSQVRNLVAMDKKKEAQVLMKKWPKLFPLPAPIQAQVPSPTAPISIPMSSIGTKLIPRDLELGMSGSDVLALQKLLIAQHIGPAAEALERHGATGLFGNLTRTAVREYQTAAGIFPLSGRCGPRTRAYLKAHITSGLWW